MVSFWGIGGLAGGLGQWAPNRADFSKEQSAVLAPRGR